MRNVTYIYQQLVFSKVERINLFIIITKLVAEPDEETSKNLIHFLFIFKFSGNLNNLVLGAYYEAYGCRGTLDVIYFTVRDY